MVPILRNGLCRLMSRYTTPQNNLPNNDVRAAADLFLAADLFFLECLELVCPAPPSAICADFCFTKRLTPKSTSGSKQASGKKQAYRKKS